MYYKTICVEIISTIIPYFLKKEKIKGGSKNKKSFIEKFRVYGFQMYFTFFNISFNYVYVTGENTLKKVQEVLYNFFNFKDDKKNIKDSVFYNPLSLFTTQFFKKFSFNNNSNLLSFYNLFSIKSFFRKSLNRFKNILTYPNISIFQIDKLKKINLDMFFLEYKNKNKVYSRSFENYKIMEKFLKIYKNLNFLRYNKSYNLKKFAQLIIQQGRFRKKIEKDFYRKKLKKFIFFHFKEWLASSNFFKFLWFFKLGLTSQKIFKNFFWRLHYLKLNKNDKILFNLLRQIYLKKKYYNFLFDRYLFFRHRKNYNIFGLNLVKKKFKLTIFYKKIIKNKIENILKIFSFFFRFFLENLNFKFFFFFLDYIKI